MFKMPGDPAPGVRNAHFKRALANSGRVAVMQVRFHIVENDQASRLVRIGVTSTKAESVALVEAVSSEPWFEP